MKKDEHDASVRDIHALVATREAKEKLWWQMVEHFRAGTALTEDERVAGSYLLDAIAHDQRLAKEVATYGARRAKGLLGDVKAHIAIVSSLIEKPELGSSEEAQLRRARRRVGKSGPVGRPKKTK